MAPCVIQRDCAMRSPGGAETDQNTLRGAPTCSGGLRKALGCSSRRGALESSGSLSARGPGRAPQCVRTPGGFSE
eukprot:3797319-Pyramimonas_sp.AAC.1